MSWGYFKRYTNLKCEIINVNNQKDEKEKMNMGKYDNKNNKKNKK